MLKYFWKVLKLRSDFGPQLRTSKTSPRIDFWVPILGSFSVIACLEILLGRSKSRSRVFFSAPKASKSIPRGQKESFSSSHARKKQFEAILYRFWAPKTFLKASKIHPKNVTKKENENVTKQAQKMNLSQHRTGSALKKLRRRRGLGVG